MTSIVGPAGEACPDAWRRIGEEKSDSLDYQPGKVFIRRLVRPEVDTLLPKNWQPAGQAAVLEQMAG